MNKVTALIALLVLVLFSSATVNAQTISIAAAKDIVDGKVVTVKGIAITASLEAASRTSFYIQDNGVGINIFKFGTPSKEIALGDSVMVTGELDTFNGLRELAVADITTDITVINSGNPVPAPRNITYMQFYNAKSPETDVDKVQGSLVRLNGLSTDPATWPKDAASSSKNVTAKYTMNDSTIAVRLLIGTEVIGATPSASLDMIGVLGTYNGSQLFPRYTADLVGTYNVTFQVDMNDAITKNNFNPATHAVVVAGAFNDWNARRDTLTDDNSDGIYTRTLKIADGTYGWKFTYNSRQYALEWDADPARELVVAGEDVDTGVLTPNLTFDDLSNAKFDKVSIQFEVNMQVQVLKGVFDKAKDNLDVRGSFNGWGAGTNLTEGLRPNIFETVVLLEDFQLGSTLNYKFVTTVDGQVGWEEPLSTSGGNRTYTVEEREYTAEERTEDGYIAVFVNDVDAVPFFNDVTTNDIFTEESTVKFQVDLRPAFYYLADSLGLPIDVQNSDKIESITGLYANGPLLAGGWKTWGVDGLGTMDEYALYDDGTHGDVKAGDTLYTRDFVFAAGADKEGVYKFGINGIDNEAFAGDNHSARIEAGGTVTNIYGAIVQKSGNVLDGIYDPYILVKDDNTVEVVRRGGVETSIKETNELVNGFELNQNYPNPFNPSTTISFAIPSASNVTLSVYNVLGQQVATLVNNQAMAAGSYDYNFDASKLSSGMYIYRLQAGSYSATRTMTLIK